MNAAYMHDACQRRGLTPAKLANAQGHDQLADLLQKLEARGPGTVSAKNSWIGPQPESGPNHSILITYNIYMKNTISF